MKFLVVVKGSGACEAGHVPGPDVLEAMGKYNEMLARAGVLLACEALHPTAEAKRVQFAGKSSSVVDGPFTETKELISGYWLWQCASMDEAVQWMKQCPNPHPDQPFHMEIRQIREMESLSDAGFGTKTAASRS